MQSPGATYSQFNVHCPRWLGVPGLVHGTTLRAALPEAGKDDFFKAIARARARGAVPTTITFGAEQVHGDRIASIIEPISEATRPPGFRYDGDLQAGEFPATDALLTTIPGVLLTIQTADCLPVFIFDETARVAGLAHCGWRGLRAGLAGKLVQAMVEAGASAARMHAWLGPCIQAGHYEVGTELVQEFRENFPGVPVSPEGTHLNLPAVAHWQLLQAGVEEDEILSSAECTLSRPDLYHSFRGEQEQSGRMLSFIGFEIG